MQSEGLMDAIWKIRDAQWRLLGWKMKPRWCKYETQTMVNANGFYANIKPILCQACLGSQFSLFFMSFNNIDFQKNSDSIQVQVFLLIKEALKIKN